MARISPLMILPPLVFAGIAALFVVGLGREDPDGLPSALAGRTAPALVVTPLGDLPVIADADLRQGDVKLVNFWASWCAPCRVEHPNLVALQAEGIAIYGVNYKDETPKALGFLESLGNPYRAAGQDADGRQAIEWGVYGVPETFVIDGSGKILLRFPGPITGRVLDETIRPAIAAARAAE
jgi:cytochrome c biogenesis protein CcmG/thiol:disulfide interchange protein DsbE